MKGMVFTELLAMAEAAFGEAAVDEVLDSLPLASGGAYTAVGSYPCSELFAIVGALSDRSGIDAGELQRQFGHWAFRSFGESYGQFFADKTDAVQMLAVIESEVHAEVRKLYPDAELPRFVTRALPGGGLEMRYASDRPLVAFCRGLIEACVAHFEMPLLIEQGPGGSDCEAVFRICPPA